MYVRDIGPISSHAMRDPQGLFDVIEFTLLTIRQPLHQVIAQRRDIQSAGGASVYLFGSKRAGWTYAKERQGYLYRVAMDILSRPEGIERTADLVTHFMQIPGLGVVKASFVVQMLGEDVACLDTHNLKALGLPESAFKIPRGLKPETTRKKVVNYIQTCRDTGGSAYWWDRWCDYVADRRGSPLKTGQDVSRYHVEAVCL